MYFWIRNRLKISAKAKNGYKLFKMADDPRWPPFYVILNKFRSFLALALNFNQFLMQKYIYMRIFRILV